MGICLMLALLCDWNYAGFVDDPATATVPTRSELSSARPLNDSSAESSALRSEERAPTVAYREADEEAASVIADSEESTTVSGRVKTAVPKVAGQCAQSSTGSDSSPAVSAGSQRWRGHDVNGDIWESDDSDRLRKFLSDRNATICASLQAPWSNGAVFSPGSLLPTQTFLGGGGGSCSSGSCYRSR